MKKILFISVLLLSSFLYAQKLECCQSVEDVKKVLAGKWKTEIDGKELIVEYIFQNGKDYGIEKKYEIINGKVEEFGTQSDLEIHIEKKDQTFYFIRLAKYGGIDGIISSLNSKKLELNSDAVYYKTE